MKHLPIGASSKPTVIRIVEATVQSGRLSRRAQPLAEWPQAKRDSRRIADGVAVREALGYGLSKPNYPTDELTGPAGSAIVLYQRTEGKE